MLEDMELGRTGERFRPLGLGIWQWGDRRYWGFDRKDGPRQARMAYDATLDAGIRFIDTAEIYGNGVSEKLLGRIIRHTGRPAFVATKFAPMPYRVSTSALPKALDASLERLGMDRVDLYQVHWPWSLLRIDPLMGRLADVVKAGKTRFVGVSNYSPKQMREAHRALDRLGVALVSNQVNYSLVHRKPESDGTLEACRELGVTLIAYSPLGQGILTGKYGPGKRQVSGIRRFRGAFRHLGSAGPLIEELERIGQAHGRAPGQVALNWLARQEGVLPIPGARDAAQARENAGAIDFAINGEEASVLDVLSERFR